MIARSDAFATARQSITAVTSCWSDGTRGPLGLCYPSGAFPQSEVDRFNQKYEGICYMFESESKSHFMTGNTFQTLLRGLLTPAYAIKRKALGLTIKDRGLLLTDAWSGFHCYKTGLNHAREAWCLSSNVKLPALQVRVPPLLD